MKEVAKKILAKIEKEAAKLDSLISKRDEFTNNYQEKMTEFSKAIKEQEKVIADLREQEKREKLEAIAVLMDKNGVSVNDLLSAVSNNDLYGIQEILESVNKTDTTAKSKADTTGNTGNNDYAETFVSDTNVETDLTLSDL